MFVLVHLFNRLTVFSFVTGAYYIFTSSKLAMVCICLHMAYSYILPALLYSLSLQITHELKTNLSIDTNPCVSIMFYGISNCCCKLNNEARPDARETIYVHGLCSLLWCWNCEDNAYY